MFINVLHFVVRLPWQPLFIEHNFLTSITATSKPNFKFLVQTYPEFRRGPESAPSFKELQKA